MRIPTVFIIAIFWLTSTSAIALGQKKQPGAAAAPPAPAEPANPAEPATPPGPANPEGERIPSDDVAEDGQDDVLQVLVIPIAGTLPAALGDSAQPFTDVLLSLTRSVGSRPVAARVGKAEIIAITGCSAESRECFDAVADTVEVDQLVFGNVQPGSEDGTVEVVLTLVKPEERSYETRRVVLRATTQDEARTEFEYKARAFLNGEPEPPDLPDADADRPQGRTLRLDRVERYTWGVTGGGAVVALTGVILLATGQARQAEVDDAPTDTVQDFEELAALEQSGKRLTGWGNGMLIAGGVITALGVALIVKQGYLDSPSESRQSIAITPILGPGHGQDQGFIVTFGGAF